MHSSGMYSGFLIPPGPVFPQAPSHPTVNMFVLHITLLEEKNIIDCRLKSCIFIEVDVLLLFRKNPTLQRICMLHTKSGLR
ncbi:MAG: hypothetical protein A2V87_07175 [Deltaproteobacteria bacterium RBG_16_58_17]|nr:MAG: hypothetical protein A2V87_07175 [Deltaproteobacteria bacterium RBG_16_58_17]OHE18537.1 MAG: hypothetical protein A2X96_00205 [Syntrophobacterales bacterium GWC2_56_13]OHE19170.1 MAG: hypothetical protein A2X95_06080 [Syntrophobacterales bacterium GWF2_56_9]